MNSAILRSVISATRRVWFVLAVVGLLLIVCGSISPQAASAALIQFTRTPASGTVISSATATFEVLVQDSDAAIDPANPTTSILIDGVAVPSVVTREGLPTRVRIKANVAVTAGAHSWRYRTQNVLGTTNLSTVWAFSVQVPPSASQFSPYPGTTALSPTISAKVSAAGASPVIRMYVAPQGQAPILVPSTFDSVTGVVRYTPSTPLQDTTVYDVTIDMTGTTGLHSIAMWSFLVDSSATVSFTNHSPAPSSVTTMFAPPLRVLASSSLDLDPLSVEVYLDGASRTPTVIEVAGNILDVSATSGSLVDGVHSVRVLVRDGMAFEETWSFTVGAPPTLINPAPAGSSTSRNARPFIGLDVSDNTSGPMRVELNVDGASILDAVAPQGTVGCSPPGDLSVGSHVAAAVVTDAAGNSATLGWTFEILPPAPMSTTCVECHSVVGHSVNTGTHECSGACHRGHTPGPATPLGVPTCGGCHGDLYEGVVPIPNAHGTEVLTSANCTTCHTSAWPAIPMHTASRLTSAHAGTLVAPCTSCHTVDLVAEHGKYPSNSPFKLQCTSCHASTDPDVIAAIASGNTACTACHSGPGHGPKHDGGLLGQAGCSGCHQDNISVQHAENCDGCHASADPKVVSAIAGGSVSCGSCHDVAAAHGSIHEGGFAVATGCEPCHSSDIAKQHGDDCATCHDSAKPDVQAAISAGEVGCIGRCHERYHGGRSPASSSLFFFDFQEGSGVTEAPGFKRVFPDSWNVSFAIDNGDSGSDEAMVHGSYSQSSAKCGVCHAVHSAPTAGTSAYSTPDTTLDATGTGQTASRYGAASWTAAPTTELLLRSTANGACAYCHISSGPTKMYGGDATLALFGTGENSWNEFYGHTTACTSCHSVHGANTFRGAGTARLALKYQGVKKLGNVALVVQPEVYSDSPLYASRADMLAGTVKPDALADGVTARQAAITAQCSICHANYSPAGNQVINPAYSNPTLFQPASWASANGSVATFTVSAPTTSLPGVPGITYTSTAGSLVMAYKNHPMKRAGAVFNGAGASAGVKGLIPISGTNSYTCLSCHNADRVVDDVNGSDPGGKYLISSFPHYTPGYYKFMKAQDQAQFDTPATLADLNLGRRGYYSSGFGSSRAGRPAVMNDGYCMKCHTTVGTDY